MRIKHWAIFVCIGGCFLLAGINHGIWRPDEPQVVGICAGMARSGDYVVPRLNGKPFLEKPPLYYAVAALSARIGGADTDVPYRLASLLFAALAVLATYGMAARRSGWRTGIAAAAILSSSWLFFRLARWIQVDIALVCCVALAMYAYFELMRRGRPWHAMALGLALGLAFMAKGLIGPALVASAIGADMLLQRNPRLVLTIRPFTVMLFFLVPIALWIAALWGQGGWPFVREVLVVNNLMRFTGAPEGAALGHQHGPLFYLEYFPREFLPWTLLFIPALLAALRNRRHDPYLGWFVGPIILLTLSSTKRGVYLAPLFPAAACMLAHYLQTGVRPTWERVLAWITWAMAIAGIVAPCAGFFLGQPRLAVAMGVIAIGGLALIMKSPVLRQPPLALSLVMCLAMSASMSVYYAYLKPHEDYLGFTRAAVQTADSREITVLSPDEIFEGVLPMLTGRTYATVAAPADISSPGLYIWADKRDKILRQLQSTMHVDMLREQRVGGKQARLAYIRPKAPPAVR